MHTVDDGWTRTGRAGGGSVGGRAWKKRAKCESAHAYEPAAVGDRTERASAAQSPKTQHTLGNRSACRLWRLSAHRRACTGSVREPSPDLRSRSTCPISRIEREIRRYTPARDQPFPHRFGVRPCPPAATTAPAEHTPGSQPTCAEHVVSHVEPCNLSRYLASTCAALSPRTSLGNLTTTFCRVLSIYRTDASSYCEGALVAAPYPRYRIASWDSQYSTAVGDARF